MKTVSKYERRFHKWFTISMLFVGILTTYINVESSLEIIHDYDGVKSFFMVVFNMSVTFVLIWLIVGAVSFIIMQLFELKEELFEWRDMFDWQGFLFFTAMGCMTMTIVIIENVIPPLPEEE